MSKKTIVSIRLDEDERKYLSSLAKQNGLALSEYMRIRLLEKEQLDKSSGYKKDMTTFALMGYYLLGKMAKKQLPEEEIKDARKRTAKTLAEYNMQKE